jgi:hypothetical protein
MSKTISTLFIVLFLSYGICQAGDKDKNIEYENIPKPHEGYEVKDGKIYYRQGKAGAIIEPADDQVIIRYFQERGSSVADPFVGGDEELSNSTYFLVSLLNHSKGALTFTPGYVALKIKTDASFPIDFTVLMSIMQGMDAYPAKLLEKSVFHSPEMIRPGDFVSKFLVFPPLPKKDAELKMEFDYLFFEGSELKQFFYFTRQKKGEAKSKGTVYKNQ